MTAHAASHIYFGLDAMWVSTGILAITYAVIMSERAVRLSDDGGVGGDL